MKRILVAEDEPDIALGLEEDLRRNGYEIQTVSDGESALSRGRGEAWDLILLDVMLPRMEGFDVCRELRRAGVATPIILLTSKAQESEKVLGFELGADDYVTKPFSPRELRARISALLRRSEHGSSAPAEKRILRYQIQGRLGAGGMGVIYKAVDTLLGRPVALKFLPENIAEDAEALRRFKLEARTASALNHPNICTIHDIADQDGRPFLVMELLEGQPLSRRIAGKPVPIDQLLSVAIQIAGALQGLHSKGIVHRDIKSSNIFVASDGHTKLLDFGLAKVAPQPDAPTLGAERTEIGSIVGTISNMSPEQVLGRVLDGRSDLFSFGVVLYEMAAGTLPFIESTWTATANAIVNTIPASVLAVNPAMPRNLVAIIDKALEKDPNSRYQTAADMKEDLTQSGRSLGMASTVTA
jgi:serine/threonine protein kinase